MKSVIQFFNPKPLLGIFIELPGSGDWSCPEFGTQTAGTVELVDVSLLPSGHLVLTLQAQDASVPSDWLGMHGVIDAADGSIALDLGDGRHLAFPARERERVSALFLRLANRQN
ncbi:hypothetical protein [Plasticicumulans acidivorans]|uniref:Uncharacterized protein n=1 Tax=Plasticicumulans acidivorans TaxID=886464 RepID=A0A317MWY9_9GAMM|nr:hypothetical protein [Plasticicumulans acidivorans]PWV63260.1 hypothetical protein C7443_103185 [Plasticicumulans acidivorans]